LTATAGASWILAFGLSHLRPFGTATMVDVSDGDESAEDEDESAADFSQRGVRPRATSV
jgi:hypothetical protein